LKSLSTYNRQRTTDIWINSLYCRLGLLFLCILVASLLLYKIAIVSLISAVIHREGSSHGVFVPFLSAFFLWTKRETLRELEPRYDYLGIPVIIVGALFGIFYAGAFQVRLLSFLALASGLIILIVGRNAFKEVAFPVLFLIAMIPIPEGFYVHLADLVRDITFAGSSWLISLFGITYHKKGLLIHLPNAVLSIATGCSGIRYLVSYFVFGIAYAYLYREGSKSRLLIVLSTIPISLAASVCRLTAIFTLTYMFGPRMAEYWPHVFISWSVFLGVLILTVALDLYLHARYFESAAERSKPRKLEGDAGKRPSQSPPPP
jgi:exosortase